MSTGRGGVVGVVGWIALAAAGCGATPLTRPADGSGGGGGRGASALGGTGGARVAGDAGTAGRGGAAGGGMAGGGAAGVEGGTSGAAGDAGGPGGAGGAASNPNGAACLPVTKPLITDFSFVPDAGSTSSVHFGDDATTFSGEEYVYPTGLGYPLSSDVTGNSWHISGTVGDYSGFGLSFDDCSRLDASAYSGISFTISGMVGMGGTVTMDVGTLDDTTAASWIDANGGTAAANAPGLCIPTSGNAYYHPGCADPTATISVLATPTTVNLKWSDFTGGQPGSSVNASGIVAISWYFPAPAGAGTSGVATYPVDVTLDNLTFIP